MCDYACVPVILSWFRGAMKREDAERHLMFSPVGSFLVRNKVGNPRNYALSVKYEDKVRHHVIQVMDGGRYFLTRQITFATIPELIDHYSEQGSGWCITLRYPCLATDPPQTAGLSKEANQAWDIEWSSIHLLKMLENGHGSTLWEGKWNDTVPIAVRVFDSDILVESEFRNAVAVMRSLRHPNLVQVLAAYTQEDPAHPIFMVTELMTRGSLLQYLRGDGRSLKVPQLIQMGIQVADGMAYLEERMYTHGNLAAKNVLISNNLTCRVADYGMTQEHLYVNKDNSVSRYSLNWAAPEAVKSNKFTIKSDVWSFGILLYELITHGSHPYPDTSRKVFQGYRYYYFCLSCPEGCPQQLYDIMTGCWREDATYRPAFSTLQWMLEDVSCQLR